MKNITKKLKGKKVLSVLLAVIMVLSVASPAISPLMGLIAKAADGDTVELAFNNVFVFEAWNNNTLSTTVQGTAPGKLETDVEAGSFTLTKTDTTKGEVYTCFSMSTGEAAYNNFSYYMADVEASTTYKFSYNLAGTVSVFTPFVFMFDKDGEYLSMVTGQTTTLGDNSFEFTTGSDTAYIQVRFTINETASSVYATVSDIVISDIDIKYGTDNLFKFESWADSLSNDESAFYPNGTVNANSTDKSISIVTSTSGASLFTAFSIAATDGSNNDYYSIDVEPNTSYTLFYTLSNDSTIQNFVPYIARYNSKNGCIDYFPLASATHYGESSAIFTTTSDTEYVSVVFSINHNNQVWTTTVSNIGVYETEITDNRIDPHRLVYTEGAGTYGELPTPANIPVGKVFAGWYTGKDGSGERITADTEISYKSYTVYPKFETKIDADSLKVVTQPNKTTYTVGEKFNPAGLVLEATVTTTEDVWNDDNEDGVKDDGEVTTETRVNTFNITSGYSYSPQTVGTTAGAQNIIISYGGQTVTVPITVVAGIDKTITVNDAEVTAQVANNVYTLNYTAPEAFSRYELTYYSDSYVKGTITMADGTYEEFFLEPSTRGSFASYIDDYLTGGTYADIKSIAFESLNKEFGNFELYSVDTIYVEKPADTMAYYENTSYKAGINLAWGGVLAYLQDLNQDNPVMSATYEDGITKVNYEGQLPAGATSTSNNVNLINTFDKGRYVQQSYYGTREEPYVLGNYNGVEWNYNPIQGGNILGEASKVVDYRITDTEIYVKTRPLEWAKWSDEAGQKYNAEQPDDNLDKELIYEDSYNAWAYMESWYVFEDGMLKTYCRYVDYSGYPSATTTQEFPAFYCVEPLNNFVYYSGGEAWSDGNKATWESDLDFWGASPEYNEMLIANGLEAVDPHYDCNENWSAFMGGTSDSDFGIGIYTADVTDFVAGSFQTKYQENQTTLIPQETSLRHADTTDPATENPTSYISPIDTMELESYKEYTYSYYITTGTQEQIREDFRMAKEKDEAEAAAGTKIAVPETVYMEPVGSPDATTTKGQYYVNNVINGYNVETIADSKDGMYFGIYSVDAKQYKISVTNATNPSDDIILGLANGTSNVEGNWYAIGETGGDIRDEAFSLRFASTGLKPGEIATAKWEITVEYDDGTTKTHTAYTVLYAPGLTVGAVAEGRYDSAANTEISSWITGANGVDHSQRAPLGSFHGDYHDSGYFKLDPLAYPDTLHTGGSSQTAYDYIYTTNADGITAGTSNGTSTDYTDNSYVLQTATNGSDGSRSQSYLGLLTVDKSRYTNTNQVPNLKMGYDVLRVGSAETDSLASYTTYYTLGTADSYTSTSLSEAPSGWTVGFSGEYLAKDNASYTDRRTVTPSYSVSDIDGKYIHAVNQAETESMNILDWISSTYQRYATAGTSVLCSVTDKAALRDSVLEGYNISKDDYSEDSYNKMIEKLQPAATVLGDPSASQEEIDNAQKELEDALDGLVNVYYSLKYDNIFSAYELSKKLGSMTASQPDYTTVGYENGVITVENVAMTAGETYTKYGSADDYYKVTLQPNTEYVFEYDVTTTSKAQAFMFFYNASGANGDVPTNMSIKTNNGSWNSKTESNAWFGNYTNSAGTYHYAIKFTTGANTTQASFRFGNTSSEAVTSSFSNIKLVTSDKYYEDAIYSATEAVYKEYASYGTMATVTRPGYTFSGWQDENGTTVTGGDIATAHKSIYSTWSTIEYTITYNANGGTVSPASQKYTIESALTLPTPTLDGYTFTGWKVTSAEGSWAEDGICPAGDVSARMYGNVTLTAQWNLNSFPVLFDTILDFSKWNTSSASNGKISNVTANGFTLTSNEGAGEGTSESPEFPVTAGKQYYIDIDFEGDNWDVYIFFRSDSVGGTGINFSDNTNRFASSGAGNQTRVFTAPAGATKAVIRVDANGSSNSVTFSDIRVYEVDTCAADVYVPDSSIDVTYGDTFGTLPVPTKEGYTFLGWYDGENEITAETIVSYSATTTLYSKWQINDTALVADAAVVDFGLPVTIEPLENDTIFMRDGASQTILGLSKDGGSYASSLTLDSGTLALNGNEVTFTPSGIVNAVETVYYHASVVIDGKTETIKNQIKVAPASNVYYEETKMSDGAAGKEAWETTGEQAASNSVEDDVVYGYNSAYDASSTYSNGTALEAVVNSTNKTASTKTFTFTGTGVDIISACGRSTGVIVVNVKDSKGKRVKGYIVDTYYSEGSFDGDDLITQVPVVNWSGAYGTYTVDVAAMYLSSAGAVKETITEKIKSSIKNNLIDTGLVINSGAPVDNNSAAEMLENAGLEEFIAEDMEFIWFDDNSVLNGGTGVEATKTGSRGVDPGTAVLYNYIDGFRVYNPLNEDSSLYSETEKNVSYANVVANLAAIEDDSVNGTLTGIAYITGSLAEGEALTFAKYQEIGPKGELYLNGGKSISFKITVQPNEKIMLGLRAVNGAVEKINISSSTTFEVDKVNSATEMYYDITSCLSEVVKTNGGTVTITVNNTDDNILAVNHIKFSGADSIVTDGITARSVSRSGDTNTEVVVNRFLPMTQADLDEIQTVLTGESTPATIQNGVVVPVIEEDDTTTGGDTTGDDTTGDDTTGDDTAGDDVTSNTFDIFSLLKMLLAFIENILRGAFGNGNIF